MKDEISLYPQRDPQQRPVYDRCRRCGRERYGPGGHCHYCSRFFP